MKTKEKIESKIAKLQKELKEMDKPKLCSGWYIASCNETKNYLCYFTNPNNKLLGEYWFTPCRDSFGVSGLFTEIERKATDKEVEDALIKEAKKRGYKEGVQCYSAESKDKKVCTGDFYYNGQRYNQLQDTPMNTIFKDGQWAEIIKEPKVIINGS